jgi:hypothetical protein
MYLPDPTSHQQAPPSSRLPDPPGFISTGTSKKKTAAESIDSQEQKASDSGKQDALKLKKAWELAFMPLKSLPMNGFMLWMSGNGIQIFSIIITVMLLYNPLKAIISVQQAFRDLEPSSARQRQSLLACKFAYCLANCVSIVLGVWKCSSMGLLPTSTSDWLAFERVPSSNIFAI